MGQWRQWWQGRGGGRGRLKDGLGGLKVGLGQLYRPSATVLFYFVSKLIFYKNKKFKKFITRKPLARECSSLHQKKRNYPKYLPYQFHPRRHSASERPQRFRLETHFF